MAAQTTIKNMAFCTSNLIPVSVWVASASGLLSDLKLFRVGGMIAGLFSHMLKQNFSISFQILLQVVDTSDIPLLLLAVTQVSTFFLMIGSF